MSQVELNSGRMDRGCTLVHISAQPELLLSLKFTEINRHVSRKLFTSSHKVDECQSSTLQLNLSRSGYYIIPQPPTVSLEKCSRQAEKWTSGSPCRRVFRHLVQHFCNDSPWLFFFLLAHNVAAQLEPDSTL